MRSRRTNREQDWNANCARTWNWRPKSGKQAASHEEAGTPLNALRNMALVTEMTREAWAGPGSSAWTRTCATRRDRC